MKLALVILACVWSLASSALTVRVVRKRNQLLFELNIKMQLPTSVGEATVDAFEQGEVFYQGGAFGIVKMFDLTNDVEVISDMEMKAYGWCFSLDGITTDTMADKTPVASETSVIEWSYAYAHYVRGEWTAQCVRD